MNAKKDSAGMVDMPEETIHRRTQNKTVPAPARLVGGVHELRFLRIPSRLLRLLNHYKVLTVISPGEKVCKLFLQKEAETFVGIPR